MTFISSLSLMSPLRASVLQAQAALSQAQTEVSTGTLADLGLTLGAGTGAELSLKTQVDELNGYTTSNNSVTTRLSATSGILTTMLSSAQALSSVLVTASSAGGQTDTLQSSATSALKSLISGLNTSVAGESVFGGINSGATPIADYFSSQTSVAKQSIDDAFTKAFGTTQTSSDASSIDGTSMQSFLSNQFAPLFSDAHWQSWSSASSTTMQTTIAPSQSIPTSVSANDTSFRQIAEAYTMVSEFTGSNLSDSARAAVVSTASQLLSSGIAALTNVQSTIGIAQNSISSANLSISAQVGVLQTNIGNVESVNTYDLSSRVTALQTQLEASYEMTSRLQSLSLTNYLTSGG